MEKIYIVTPCCRSKNLDTIEKSIDFSIIHKWYIVYDTSKNRSYQKKYLNHPHIVELECSDVGRVGHAQRNFAINVIEDGFIYFLDDDNIIHPDLYAELKNINKMFYYTWDQLRNKEGDNTDWVLFKNEKGKILKGNKLKVQAIDTAQFMFPRDLIGDLRWDVNDYKADGIFIEKLNQLYPNRHVYIPRVLSYYNFIE
jgi:hypothetical protein